MYYELWLRLVWGVTVQMSEGLYIGVHLLMWNRIFKRPDVMGFLSATAINSVLHDCGFRTISEPGNEGIL